MAKFHATSAHEEDFWYRGKLYKHGDEIVLDSEEEYNSLIHNDDPFQIIKLKKSDGSHATKTSNTGTGNAGTNFSGKNISE